MRIVRHPVESSSIAAIGYLEPAAILEVEFRNGSVYRYFEVPPSAYRALGDADSIGRHFNREIRPRFRYARRER